MNKPMGFLVYQNMKLPYALLITATVCGLACGSVLAGGAEKPSAEESGRLIIRRSPNFGNQEQLNLYIDGKHVSSFGYGRQYEGVLPAGEYWVTVKQSPHWNDAYPFSQQRIRVLAGRENVFTAFWTNGGTRIVLDES